MGKSKQLAVKRIADVIIATIGFCLLSPLFLVIPLSVGASPLFLQERYGKNGSRFTLMKFRTMRRAAASGEIRDIKSGDGRTTRIGRILRSVNLDEIPQLLNVIKGDMSIVGPRPIPVSMAVKHLANWEGRSKVTPGIFGLAQIYCTKYTTLKNKFRYDILYADNWSLLLDFQLSVKAFWNMKIRPALIMVGWTTILLALLWLPIPESDITVAGIEHIDKLAHYALFFITVLVAAWFGSNYFSGLAKPLWFGIVWSLSLGGVTEYVQSFLPVRNMSLLDFGADVAGIGAGVMVMFLLRFGNNEKK